MAHSHLNELFAHMRYVVQIIKSYLLTFLHLKLQISLTLPGITYYKSMFTFIFLFGLLPLAVVS